MGAHTTIQMTREQAIQRLVSEIQEPHVPNKIIESLLDILLDSEFYNCSVVPDWVLEDQKN